MEIKNGDFTEASITESCIQDGYDIVKNIESKILSEFKIQDLIENK